MLRESSYLDQFQKTKPVLGFFYQSISLMPHLFDKCVYYWNWNQQVACCFKLPSPFFFDRLLLLLFLTRYIALILSGIKVALKRNLKVWKMCQFNRSLCHIGIRKVRKNNSLCIYTWFESLKFFIWDKIWKFLFRKDYFVLLDFTISSKSIFMHHHDRRVLIVSLLLRFVRAAGEWLIFQYYLFFVQWTTCII